MTDPTALDRCTVSTDGERWCGDPSVPDAPIPICFTHASQILAFMAEAFDAQLSRLNHSHMGYRYLGAVASGVLSEQRAKRVVTNAASVVYYVQVGDLIKIGTSTNVKTRIRAYPPGAKLLATEPGSYDLESQRLQEFADALTHGKEWFTPTRRLLAHIDAIANAA